jgi:hypothetical protein
MPPFLYLSNLSMRLLGLKRMTQTPKKKNSEKNPTKNLRKKSKPTKGGGY